MDDLHFIVGLMKQNTHELGFIPASTLATQYLAGGRYLLQGDMRGRRLGYLLHGAIHSARVLSISQAVIDCDYRNRGFGEAMVARLVERAKLADMQAIKLRCASNLQANEFWQAQGFVLTRIDSPFNTRKRTINTYVLDLWPRLF